MHKLNTRLNTDKEKSNYAFLKQHKMENIGFSGGARWCFHV